MTGIGDDEFVSRPAIQKPSKSEPGEDEQETLTRERVQQMSGAVSALLQNPSTLAKWRNWKRETIETLANEGSLGLWNGEFASETDQPAFIFKGGLKTRTRASGKETVLKMRRDRGTLLVGNVEYIPASAFRSATLRCDNRPHHDCAHASNRRSERCDRHR